ncbi:MAG: hypothetical protein ACO3NL_00080 [Phycisphaerales bacterium]
MSFSITASVVVAVGTTAYNANRARKAQEKAEQSNLIRRMAIEGQAPELLDIGQGITDQPIMGSDISQALQALRYDPNAGFMQMLETQQAPAEQEIPPEVLEQLMMEQQAQYADGGPVGRGEDTYFFTIEDIEGLMAEPDPMMQNVGAGLMAQMAPGMGAVPATPGQIQMMAEGGLIGNQYKIDKNNNGRIDAQDFKILRRRDGGDLDPDYLEEIPIDLADIIEEIPFNVKMLTTEAKDVGPEYDEVVMLGKGDGEELVEGRDYFIVNGQFMWPWEVDEYLLKGTSLRGSKPSFMSNLAAQYTQRPTEEYYHKLDRPLTREELQELYPKAVAEGRTFSEEELKRIFGE